MTSFDSLQKSFYTIIVSHYILSINGVEERYVNYEISSLKKKDYPEIREFRNDFNVVYIINI